MKLAVCQMKMEDKEQENLEKIVDNIKEAAENGADMILFPELVTTPFFPQYRKQAVKRKSTTIRGKALKIISEACREHKITAIVNVYLREIDQFYNSSFLIDKEGEIIGSQKMVHIPQTDYLYGQDYFQPSPRGFQVFDTRFGRVGMIAGFDRHYPESIRNEVMLDADLILISAANTKAENGEMFEWEIRVQAFQNSVAIAMCNRAGVEDSMDFSGESMIVDAQGNILEKADDKEQIIYADVAISQSSFLRNKKAYTSLRKKNMYS